MKFLRFHHWRSALLLEVATVIDLIFQTSSTLASRKWPGDVGKLEDTSLDRTNTMLSVPCGPGRSLAG